MKANNLTQGGPFGLILKFTIPLFLGNAFQQVYNMTDSVIVGKFVGAGALAAVGSTGTIMFLVIGVSMGLATGFSVMTSQYFGAKDERGVRISVTNGIMLSLLASVVITVVSLTSMPLLLHLMNTPKDIYEQALTYIRIICGGITGILFYNLFAAFLRAIGNSRAPLFFLILSAGINILLDLLFILVFRLGVAGAALATTVAQSLSGLFCAAYIYFRIAPLKPSRRDWQIDRHCLKRQLAIGIPMALETAITASGTLIMQAAINIYGTIAVAGSTAAYKLINLFTQGHYTLSQTMASYAGQNYGAGKKERLIAGTKAAMVMNLIYSVVMASVGILFMEPFVSVFFSGNVSMAEMMPWARVPIIECGLTYIFLGMIFIYRSTLQGCGFSILAMTMGIVELTARTVCSFVSISAGSYNLAIAADPAAWITAGVFGYVLYRRQMKCIL